MTQATAPAIDIDILERTTIQRMLGRHLPGVTVWAYGSRVRWNARPQSDLDLVAFAPPEQRDAVLQLREAFEESSLPFTVDLLIWDELPESFHRNIEAEYVVLQSAKEENSNNAWREAVWGELATLEYGKSLRGYHTSTGHYRVYGTNGQIGWHSEPLCPNASVIIGRKGAYRGVHYSPDSFFVIDTAFYLKPKVEIDTRWAYYQLLTMGINGMDSGSAIPSTSREDFYGLPVVVPPLPEQHAIAHILGALDDKIELNRRMNQTLEEMARAIFQDWFVDFGPVRAKLEGRESYLPLELWALFPERLVDSELGKIPEGWEVKALGEVVDVAGGTTPSTKIPDYWDGGIHCWATPKDLSSLSVPVLLDTERKITDSGLKRIGSGLQPKGTVLLSSRAPIGYLAINEVPVAINQGFIAIQPRKGVSNLFLLYWCKSSLDEIVSHANGSTFLEISKSNFRQIPLVMPTLPVSDAYHPLASNLYDRIIANERSSRALAAQRDLLLPKLVSGEVRGGGRQSG